MTNPALDALDKMEQRLIELCAWHEEGEIEQQAKTIRTALSNAPEVVTVDELERRYWSDETALCFGSFIKKHFPNGLKITAAPNGGG